MEKSSSKTIKKYLLNGKIVGRVFYHGMEGDQFFYKIIDIENKRSPGIDFIDETPETHIIYDELNSSNNPHSSPLRILLHDKEATKQQLEKIF